MYRHDLQIMNSSPGCVELGVLGTSVLVTDGRVLRAGVSVT